VFLNRFELRAIAVALEWCLRWDATGESGTGGAPAFRDEAQREAAREALGQASAAAARAEELHREGERLVAAAAGEAKP